MESEAESVKNLSAGVETGAGFAASDQLNIPGQGLEPCTVRLQNGDGDVAGLARVDVLDDTRLASMSSADDFAPGAVFQLFVGRRLHAGDDSTFFESSGKSWSASRQRARVHALRLRCVARRGSSRAAVARYTEKRRSG